MNGSERDSLSGSRERQRSQARLPRLTAGSGKAVLGPVGHLGKQTCAEG